MLSHQLGQETLIAATHPALGRQRLGKHGALELLVFTQKQRRAGKPAAPRDWPLCGPQRKGEARTTLVQVKEAGAVD